MNAGLATMFKRWGINHTSTGGYQPQANPVERYHRFMNSAMTMLSDKFGEDWPEYLPAVSFAYNASTNDATGFSPYELVYGGKRPTLLHEIDLLPQREDPTGTSDRSEYHKEAGARLQAAYTAVREQQERMAAKNRASIEAKKGPKQKMLPVYEKGDSVLFWEPKQPKAMQSAEQRLRNVTVTEAPRKWKSPWSGPHQIVDRKPCDTGYRYTFYHKERGKNIETHVNKISPFNPWAEGLASTSWDIDGRRLYRAGDWVENGALVVVPLERPYPFGVAKVLSCDDEGDLKLQWYGNSADDIKSTFEPGWTTSKKGKAYYTVSKREAHHLPYTTCMDGITMNQRDVLIHSFQLTKSERLPAPLLRAIAKHPYVWWDPKATDILPTSKG